MDEEAFARLFLEYKPKVLRVAKGIFPSVDIKELDEIYTNLWAQISEGAKKTPIKIKTLQAYLIRCLRNAVLNEKNHGRLKSVSHVSIDDPGILNEVDAKNQVFQVHYTLDGEEPDRLECILSRLPSMLRKVAIRQFIDGATQKEIARELQCSERWVGHITKRLKVILREQYRQLGITQGNQQLYTKRRR